MLKFWNLLIKILKDERGALLDWGLDWMAAKKRGKAPSIMDMQWPNVGELERGVSENLLGRIGQPRQYQYNPAFDIEQPAAQKAAESTILGKLGNLPSAEEYKGKVETAKQQDIAREKEAAVRQEEEELNMYNDLGLASSTPWLNRAGELGEESLMRQGDISSGYDIYGLNYGLQADQLANQIASGWAGLGTTLGQQQVRQQQVGQQMSLDDIIRQAQEEESINQQIMAYLGQGAATPGQAYNSRMFQWQQPNTWDWLSGGSKELGAAIAAMSGTGV